MRATSGCHLAGLGNVRILACKREQTVNFILLSPRNAKCVYTFLLIWELLIVETDYAINNNLTPFISMQNHYNLIYREEEREMFPTLKVSRTLNIYINIYLFIFIKHFGVGSIPWSPLARGLLTRPFAFKSDSVRGKTDPCVLIYQPTLTIPNHFGS